MNERFEAIVIGAGPAGEGAASRLAERGSRTALGERELIGGECAYWTCIPSKTLLRPPEVRHEAQRTAGTETPEQRWSEVAEYRDFMIRHLDDARWDRSWRAPRRQCFRRLLGGFIAQGHDDPERARESAAAHWPGYDQPAGAATLLQTVPGAKHFMREDHPHEVASTIKRVVEQAD